jgi:hypothetical protein
VGGQHCQRLGCYCLFSCGRCRGKGEQKHNPSAHKQRGFARNTSSPVVPNTLGCIKFSFFTRQQITTHFWVCKLLSSFTKLYRLPFAVGSASYQCMLWMTNLGWFVWLWLLRGF